MFSIQLLSGPLPKHLEGENSLVGEIVIGNFRERFAAPLHYWKPIDYAKQWTQGLERIVRAGKDSCLVGGMDDPLTGGSILWWPLYRDGETVHVQNCLYFLRGEKGVRRSFDPRDPYGVIPPRTTMSEEGEKVSEWTIPLVELEEFLASRPAGWTGC